ncbi:MAG: class I tRNA ligase family protein, partial [Chloroflexota bacterium]
ELHLGHAMFVAVEDLMIRYHRMKGEPTLWVPGTDHAGIATQLQVEKALLREEEVTREELGREEFVRRAWQWKEKYGNIIYNQIRRLGASCDWDRVRFTLDDGLSKAVRHAFVSLYKKGLIYRGTYLVNWSPGLKTAVSDVEVEYSEEEGKLYFFKYKLKDSDDFLPVATTRPETILGDAAVAVHPDDDRYQALVGKTVIVPILN